jgi:hypothetical protein
MLVGTALVVDEGGAAAAEGAERRELLPLLLGLDDDRLGPAAAGAPKSASRFVAAFFL